MALRRELLREDHHVHPLTWVGNAESFTCSGCKQDGYDVRYACGSCSFHLHEVCAKEFGSSLPHPLKRSNLLFSRSPSQPEHPCRGCGGKVTGYAYVRERRLFGCILGRGTVLHPWCAALPTSFGPAAPLIPVKLELKRKLKSPCCSCGRVRFEGRRRTWGYVSADKAMQIHVACAKRMFRQMYENARQRRPSMVSRFIASLMRTLSSSNERPGTGETGSDSAGAGAVSVPDMEMTGVPESRREWVTRAVWSAICTVGAVIIGTDNAVGMISSLVDVISTS